jgi:DNA-binding GntR family transcriptional regulator
VVPLWIAALHIPILNALNKRDPELVVEALREHFNQASSRFSQNWTGGDPDAADSPE